MSSSYFMTGISTGVGKTVASAVLAQALGFDYWKPVQCGDLEATDSHRVAELAPERRIFPEAYRLAMPASPHTAAAAEGQRIALTTLVAPSNHRIIVEGAGGALVPLNDQHLMVDLMVQLGMPAVIVSRHYLGSINHTLMTCEVLRAKGVSIAGLILVGPEDPATEQAFKAFAGTRILGRLPLTPCIDRDWVRTMAAEGCWRELG